MDLSGTVFVRIPYTIRKKIAAYFTDQNKAGSLANLSQFVENWPYEIGLSTQEWVDGFALPGIGMSVDGKTAKDDPLLLWIDLVRLLEPKVAFVLRADRNTPYPYISRLFSTFQYRHINKFNLLTNMESSAG